ncbi:ammonium transporter AmtB-like domain-containing protein [Lipomyces japonicus]|uniref:ammonium transporter AmtB-like domain-containing protein n=1 Tax=Lipomyces japonicus TaxID=56871 RepID=UPI0034CF6E95
MAELPSTLFNETSEGWTAAGGNSLDMDVNASFVASGFHMVWVMAAAVFVVPIIPGLGFFYAGLGRRKAGATMLWQIFGVTAVVSFQWFLWGHSLTYGDGASPFIGNLKNIGLKNVTAKAIGYLPEPLYVFYQGLFAVCTVLIMVAGGFERSRMVPSLVYGFCWATVVYCPVASWTWNDNGWLFNLPSLDYAGGGPVHIASGVGALAYAIVIGNRIENDDLKRRVMHFKPHNPTFVFLGAWLIWFGWFGFNGGCNLAATVRATYVIMNTNIAACTGVIGWCVVDMIKYKGRFSIVGACEGCIAGLVGITPAAGYVPVYFAALIGFVTAVGVRVCENVNEWIGVDEGIEAFRLHTIGGVIGSLMTGLFATEWVAKLDGASTGSGWLDHNYRQLGYQLAEITSIAGYTFVVSMILLLVIDRVPGLKLRVPEHEEIEGVDNFLLMDEGIGDMELDAMLKKAGFTFMPESIINGSTVAGVIESSLSSSQSSSLGASSGVDEKRLQSHVNTTARV